MFLAYQMPYGRVLRKPDTRHCECVLATGYEGLRVTRLWSWPGLVMILGRAGAIEMKNDFTEEANVEF